MNSQLIVDYIGKKRVAGYSEGAIRKALLRRGLSEQTTAELFRRYHQTQRSTKPARVAAKPRRGRKLTISKWPLRRVIRMAVLVVLLAGVAFGAHLYLTHRKPKVVAAPVKPLTYQQKQSADEGTVAGAIAQYAAATGALPALLTVGPSSNILVLCNASCDPATAESSTLIAYKAGSIKLQPYVAGLAVPDDQTMYLVPGASCKDKSTLGDPNPVARSMVLLYAVAVNSALQQHCVTL